MVLAALDYCRALVEAILMATNKPVPHFEVLVAVYIYRIAGVPYITSGNSLCFQTAYKFYKVQVFQILVQYCARHLCNFSATEPRREGQAVSDVPLACGRCQRRAMGHLGAKCGLCSAF